MIRSYVGAFSGGVPIDGRPDDLPLAPPAWEQVSGPHGTLTHVGSVETTVDGLELSSYRSAGRRQALLVDPQALELGAVAERTRPRG